MLVHILSFLCAKNLGKVCDNMWIILVYSQMIPLLTVTVYQWFLMDLCIFSIGPVIIMTRVLWLQAFLTLCGNHSSAFYRSSYFGKISAKWQSMWVIFETRTGFQLLHTSYCTLSLSMLGATKDVIQVEHHSSLYMANSHTLVSERNVCNRG